MKELNGWQVITNHKLNLNSSTFRREEKLTNSHSSNGGITQMQKLMYIVAYDYLDDTHTEQVCATESIAEAIAEFNDTCSMV